MVQLSRSSFERVVRQAVYSLPPAIQAYLENVAIVVKAWPSPEDLQAGGIESRYNLFGLYQGIALPEREGYGLALPDMITIFQRPLEHACASRDELAHEIRATVLHEVAHHFGLTDAQLEDTAYA